MRHLEEAFTHRHLRPHWPLLVRQPSGHDRELPRVRGNSTTKVCPPMEDSCVFKSLEAQDSSSDTEDGDVDQVLMVALAECYMNASTWQARRQILSIVADKLQIHTVRRWIPDLTRYRFTTAREHAIRYGRGVPPDPQVHTKMFVSQTQVDHFLDFITSPHVIQDLPFGERSLTLSTKEVISVPNVVRMLIPESIVRQYLAYSEECNFKPLSRRALLNILSVCSASVRKSLQGLDYISSAGAEAFDDLCDSSSALATILWACLGPRNSRSVLELQSVT